MKRRFCYQVKSSCSMLNDTATNRACTKGKIGLVFARGKARKHFKNYQCLICNGFSSNETICGPARFPIGVSKPKSFKILMNFLPTKGQTTTASQVLSMCRNGKVYDRYLETCRDAVISEPGQGLFDKYRLRLWMSPKSSSTGLDSDLDDFDNEAFLRAFVNLFALKPEQVRLIGSKKEEFSIAMLLDLTANGQGDSLNKTPNGSIASLPIKTILNFNAPFSVQVLTKIWTVFKVTKRRLACTKPKKYQPEEYYVKNSTNGVAVVIKKTRQTLMEQEYYSTKADHQKGTSKGTLLVCESVFTVACDGALISLRSGEFTLLPDKTLVRNVSGEIFKQGKEYSKRSCILRFFI